MHPQRLLSIPSGGLPPDYAAVFIGGFGDGLTGCLSRAERRFSGFLPDRKHVSAYYHWDGGGLGIFLDRCGRIADDLRLFQKQLPGTPVVLVGHSYGGSCAVEVARRLDDGMAPLCLLTIDAVARRQGSERPVTVDWWGNVWLGEGGGLMDAVPRVGGRWGCCPGADMNAAFSGYSLDGFGHLYSHQRPEPMLYDPAERGVPSLHQAASVWLAHRMAR